VLQISLERKDIKSMDIINGYGVNSISLLTEEIQFTGYSEEFYKIKTTENAPILFFEFNQSKAISHIIIYNIHYGLLDHSAPIHHIKILGDKNKEDKKKKKHLI